MTPYQKIPEACKSTGLSQYFLRNGCKNGTIPHVKSGPTYYIDVLEPVQRMALEENIALLFVHHDKKVLGSLSIPSSA